MKQRLTNKQLDVYCYMQDFFKENDQLPSASLIVKHIGSADRTGGNYHFKALTAKGYLEKNAAGGYRFKREAA
jgi:sulfur relay (sulfurtransferase) DsrC/TusE family protein